MALVSAPALLLESSRQQQAAGIKQSSLFCHGFWPSPPRQSGASLPHALSEQSCDTISKSTKVSSHNWGLTGMQGLGPKEIQAWVGLQWTQPWWCHLTGTGYVITILLWDLSQTLQLTNRFICFIVYINSLFVGKQSQHCFVYLNTDFCLGTTEKLEKMLHSEVRSLKEIASLQ